MQCFGPEKKGKKMRSRAGGDRHPRNAAHATCTHARTCTHTHTTESKTLSLPFSYGEPQWLDAPGCQRIHKTRCDLSAVTSDPREWYYARVHASCRPSGKTAWALSPRFSPRWDSECLPSSSVSYFSSFIKLNPRVEKTPQPKSAPLS